MKQPSSEQQDQIEPIHHPKEEAVEAVVEAVEVEEHPQEEEVVGSPPHKQPHTTAINYMDKHLIYLQEIVPKPETSSHNGTYTGASTATTTSLLTHTPD